MNCFFLKNKRVWYRKKNCNMEQIKMKPMRNRKRPHRHFHTNKNESLAKKSTSFVFGEAYHASEDHTYNFINFNYIADKKRLRGICEKASKKSKKALKNDR